ncbi:FAD-dependent oxidoreductase [Aeromicrobium sp.]|uniref:FAD-dependent oxidoreductase n=1 Tax=Aeromicrobium sp. TaxID=1871063 RepID=UPI002FCB23F4
MIEKLRDLLDRQLGRVTMYRLVTIVLSALAAIYILYSLTGVIDGISTGHMILSLAVVVVASYVSNRVFGLIWRIKPHSESSIITGLLLFFLFVPMFTTDLDSYLWLAGAAAIANLSKYLIAWRGRHIFNPAAAGAFIVYIAHQAFERGNFTVAIWQAAASDKMLPFVALGAFLVLWRTRRLDVGLLFIALASVLIVLALSDGGASVGDALESTFKSYPVVFLAGFMLSEPLTLPPRRMQQLVVAAVTALVFAYPLAIALITDNPPDLGWFSPTPEMALLVGNLVAFAFSRRRGVALDLVSTRKLTPETHEFTFKPKRPVAFRPGQFAELTVPHKGSDGRGLRRSFSISSPPDAEGHVTFALRVPEKSSSFKRAMVELEPGARIHATGVGGDFVLPKDPSIPVVLVAGGIGITPFISQLLHEPKRDAVLVYGVTSPEEIPYADVLAGFRVVIVSPVAPDQLPTLWRHVEAPFVSVDLVATAVPDLDQRLAYISGPPAMVNAVRAGLVKRCKRVKTDYFTGY